MDDDLFSALFGDEMDSTLELELSEDEECAPSDDEKRAIVSVSWKAIALRAAKQHGYTHCVLGYVPCPFKDEDELAFAAAWYAGRDIGWKHYIESVPTESLFGSQFPGGM